MKKLFVLGLLFISVLLVSCSETKTEFEVVNPAVGVFDLGDSWEVNISFVVKGPELKKEGDNFNSKISFVMDLVKPNGEIIINKTNGLSESNFNESKKDVSVNAQFELDSTFVSGKYKMIINVKDLISNKDFKIEKEFDLAND